MNIVEAYSTLSPYNKDEECAKITITNIGQSYSLPGVMVVGEQYTFSFWVKSDTDGTLHVREHTIKSTAGWSKHTVTFTAADADLLLRFTVAGTYYIYHPMLEIGNKAGDWTPAPEDVDESVKNISNDIVDINTGLRPLTDRFGRHFKFSTDAEDAAITISVGDNVLSLTLDPENGIIFSKNGKPFGSWDGTNFYTGNIVVRVEERAQFGNFAAVPRSDGGLSWLKVAGG